MKKLFLAISIACAISTTTFAETGDTQIDPVLSYWEKVDKNYASEMHKVNLQEATAIEQEKYSTPEERYVAGLFFYADKDYADKKRAFKQFKIAHQLGFGPATYMYGKMLVTGESGNKNLFLGRNVLQSVSGDNYYEYQANKFLAEQYLQEKNFEAAIAHYQKMKTRESTYQIAKVLEYKGETEKAFLLYKQAIGEGYIEAKIELAKRLLNRDVLDTQKAIALLTEVSDKGQDLERVSEAQTLLGDIYFKGNQSMYADAHKGVEWYKKAANNGNHEALIKLHAIYSENESNDKYRLGKNKDYIHELSKKLYKNLY